MHDSGTPVMTIGRLSRGLGASQISPQWGYDPMWGNRTASPGQPQILPRPTLQNGPHAFSGLGALGNVVQVVSLGNLGKVLGQNDATVDAPQAPPANSDPLEAANNTMMPPPAAPPGYDPYKPTVDPGFISQDQVSAWKTWGRIAAVVAPVSAAASAYHGYRRNQSVGWAIWWGLMGGAFPLLTPAIGLGQGWGERKTKRG